MSVRVTFNGLDELQKRLVDKANPDDIRRVVQKNGADLVRTMKDQTKKAYVGGYSGIPKTTGDTAGSINLRLEDGGFTAVSETGTDYSGYVEVGTRFMPPEPIAQPSLDIIGPQFISDLKRVIKK